MLTSEQRSYIVQNMSRKGDDQLASDLGVDEKLVKDFVATINEVVSHLKAEVETHQLKYASLLVEFVNDLDLGVILTLPKMASVSKCDLVIKSITNFLVACRNGQFANLLLESLKRSSCIDENYSEVYNRIRTFIENTKNEEEIISPLAVFSRNVL